jgi:hypothetical protein
MQVSPYKTEKNIEEEYFIPFHCMTRASVIALQEDCHDIAN